MSRSKSDARATSLKKALHNQGRSTAWLAKATGYSRGYVSNVLHGRVPFSEEFQRRAVEALQSTAAIPVTYRGRVVQVPESIYRRTGDLPTLTVASAYEEAWKRSWLQEHGEEALVLAAERAWSVSQSLVAGDSDPK